MKRQCLLLLCSLLLLPAALLAAEGQRSCSHCGCCLRKVVRMECTTKEVVEHCYDCKCEDFALLGPSKKYHVPCAACDGCCDQGCGHQDHVVWQPGHCGKPRTRKALVKYELVKKVPAYKCVVEYVCDRCCCGASCTQPAEELPPLTAPPPATREEKNTEHRNGQESASFAVRRANFEQAESESGFSWRSIFGTR
jgi:hypothetical protein